MKILALITARGGSKRLPNKNILELGGKPLIIWSIEVAKDIPEICKILVSTDDLEIAKVCAGADVNIPWLRPAELATDTASSVDVAIHALDWYEIENGKVDGLLLLQPTSPFRSKRMVKKGIELFQQNGMKPVVGVSNTQEHPMWTLKLKDGFLAPYMEPHGLGKRSQDLPLAYVVNGSFYLITPTELRMKRSFYGENTLPLIIETHIEALDIDTEWDFEIAKFFADKYFD